MASSCSHATSCARCAGTCGKCYTFSTLRKTDGSRCVKCFDAYHYSKGGLYKSKDEENTRNTVNKFLSHAILERKMLIDDENERSDSSESDSEDDSIINDEEEIVSESDEEEEFSGFEEDFEDGESDSE